MKKLIIAGILFTATMGCSVTSLQCGVDGDSSYLITTIPQGSPQTVKNMTDLCNFMEQKNAT